MRRCGELLTPFEQSEVLEYQQVYFVGAAGVKKIQGIPHPANNNGFTRTLHAHPHGIDRFWC
jgi:hypothetical protein